MEERDEILSQKTLTLPTTPEFRIQFPTIFTFSFRRRKVRDTVTIALRQDMLCQGQKDKMNNEALNLMYAVAVVSTLIEEPTGFDFMDVEDTEFILDTFLKLERWRAGFPPSPAQGDQAAGGTAGGQ